MENTQREGFLAKRRGKSILTVLLVLVVAGLVGPASSLAASRKHDPGTCSLSQNAAGDLVATGSGFTAGSSLQYEIYSAPQASVGGGQLSTDASGDFSADFGPASFYWNVYTGETSLSLNLYPIIGNKANMSTLSGACTYTP